MAVVGSAEIVVRAITTKVKADIQKAFADSRPAIQAEGRKAAKDFAGAFNQSLQQSLTPAMKNAMATAASSGADEAGKVLRRELPGEVGGAANAAGNAAERALGNAGRRGGNAFRKGFLNSGFADSAVAASNAFTSLFAISNLLGPAISILVGGISSAASGLFAMAAAASQAAGALAVLPGLYGALGQVLGAVKLGFMGVGEAVQAGVKAQDASAAASTAAGQAAAKAGDKAKAGAGKQIAAAKALAAAQERLKQAQDESRKAQEALNRANEKAEDGAEEQAAAQRLVATAAQQKNAVLADPNASAEQGAAAQQGLDAAKAAADALKRQQEEQEAAARKAAERADQARRKELAAQRAVDKARKGNDAAGKAAKVGGIETPAIKAANAYQQALQQLTPAAQAFVEQLLKMRERVQDLGDAIAEKMFPPLTESLKLLDNDALWRILEDNLSRTGELFGEAALSLAKLADTDVFRSGLDKWLSTNNEIIEVFTKRNGAARSGLESLASIIGKVALAIQPITKRFVTWITKMIQAKDALWEVGDATSGMQGYFKRAGDMAAQLGRIVGNVIGAIGNLGDAATPAGESLIDSFEKATAKFERFTDRINKDGSAGKYFRGVAKNFRAIGRLINQITVEFVELGDNKGIRKFANGMRPAVKNIGEIGDRLSSGGVGEALGKLAEQVSEFFLKLTDSGQVETFLTVLTKIAGAINNVIDALGKIPGAKKVAGYVLAFAAITRGVAFALKPIKFFGKAILGGPIAILRTLFKVGGKIPFLGKLLGKLGNTKVGAALGGIKKGSDSAKDALEDQMRTDQAKIDILKRLEDQAIETGAALELLGDRAAPGVEDAKQAAGPAAAAADDAVNPLITQAAGPDADKAEKKTKRFGNTMGKVGGVAKKAGGAFKGLAGGLLGMAGGPIGLLITFLPTIIKLFGKLYAKSPAFRAFINSIVKGFKSIVAWAMPIIKTVGGFLVKAIDALFKKVNAAMPTIKRVIGDVFAAISGFVKKYIIPAWNNILLPAIQKFWNVVKAVFPVIKRLFGALFSAVKFYITKIFIPVWKIIFKVIGAFLPLVRRIFGAVKTVVGSVFKFVGFVWKNVLAPVFRGIGKALGVMGGVFKTVFDKVKDIFSGFKTAFGKLWDFIKGIIDKIKNAFGTVKDAIGNAFSNLGGAVKGGLNTFIGFLNDKLIGPLNSVTSKFGMDIPDIKTFATGGKVVGPGTATSDSIAARLSNGEFVVKTQAAKALGYKNLEHMNKTGQLPAGATDGVGGLIGWAKDAIQGGVGAIAEGAEYIGKRGAGKVLSALVDVAKSAVSGLGLSNTSFIKDFALGILDKLSEAAASWGGDKGKTPPPTQYGPYANTAGLPNIQGWAYPLASRFPVTQEPNQGHRPSWAVDIGAPTGVPVIAVAAGVVKSIIDKGATSYGKYIEIAHADGTTSLYAHLNEFLIKLGQRVAAGDVIARSGHSGGVRSSTGGDGSHLHFELKPGSNTRTMMALRGVALAKGGVARATSGGVPAIIAEAGRDERVEPLDRDGMSKRDKAIIRAVSAAAGGKGSMTINVNNPEPERASTSVSKAVRSRAVSSGWSV